jgi:hypothetical protein
LHRLVYIEVEIYEGGGGAVVQAVVHDAVVGAVDIIIYITAGSIMHKTTHRQSES